MTKPHSSDVSAQPPDEDPTGVRALLSSLPAPDPMPEHLVERINASLAAEQAQRAEQIADSGSSLTPMLATARRRRGRLLFATAGAAAAITLVAVVGNSVLNNAQLTTTAAHLDGASSPGTSPDSRELAASDKDAGTSYKRAASSPTASPVTGVPQARASVADTPPVASVPAGGVASSLSPIQIRLSGTRYTSAHFTHQAMALGGATLSPIPLARLRSAAVGPLGTTLGLSNCLKAVGAEGAQKVRADIAFYEGRPAVIIVAITHGKPVAYAVGRQCSSAGASQLRPATPLP